MKRKQKRTHIVGALIFLALVAILGIGLTATGNFHNPLNFSVGGQDPGNSRVPASQTASNNRGQGQGSASGHSGPQGGGDTSGIAWNQIGGVFSNLWILSAIVACYILVQQTLGLIANRFWSRKYPQPMT